VSLVGEKERKLLKEIVKLAKTPVKSRIVATGEKEIDFCCCCHPFSVLQLTCQYDAAGFTSYTSKNAVAKIIAGFVKSKPFLDLILKRLILIFSPQR